MKVLTAISLSLNLALGSAVLYLAPPRDVSTRRAMPASDPTSISDRGPRWEATEPAQQTAIATNPAPAFRWSAIESTDYKKYIANLRGIGCPEQTIHDIIFADVDAACFASRRNQIEQTAQLSDDAQANPVTRRVAAAELKQLRTEEGALVESLLTFQTGTLASALTPLARHVASQSTQALTPLAFRQLDPAAAKLNAQELQFIGIARENFVQDLGGPNQDPSDPAYRQRWQAARRFADQSLRGMLGDRHYQQVEEQAEAAEAGGQQ